jgi:hypothetical protein
MTTLITLAAMVVLFGAIMLVVRIQVRRAVATNNAALQALRPTAIRELVDGARVRVIGTANGTELVKAPYTGAACLAFHGSSSARTAEGRRSQTLRGPDTREVRPFTIDDGTGTIAVDVAHVRLDLALHLPTDEDVQNNVFGARMLARDTAGTSYYEHILEPASPVAVIGTVSRGDDGALRLVGTAATPLVVSNHTAALAAG